MNCRKAFALSLALIGAAVFAQSSVQSVMLNSGHRMPLIGLGTWTLRGETCEAAVYTALKAGYRLIDTARYYGNEVEVGRAVRRAIAEGVCRREDIFITTKLLPSSTTPERDIASSLANLQVDYIDLVLLHQHGRNDDGVYLAMAQAAKEGKVRSIGISNFYSARDVNHFIEDFDTPPAVIQNENHLYYQNEALREFAAARGIVVQSYYPLGGRGHTQEHFTNPAVTALAAKYGKSAAQVILRWHVQAGYSAVPGSSNPAHIAENINVFDFELTASEMQSLRALDAGKRYEKW